MKYFLILVFFIGLLDAKIYRKGNETVVDSVNKLMWVDSKKTITILKTHEEALPYCKNLGFAGYKNWRVPTIKELETIVDKKNELNYINRAFKYNVPDGYWALKSHWRTLWFYADYMHFVSGTPYYDSRHKKKYIRCVRSFN